MERMGVERVCCESMWGGQTLLNCVFDNVCDYVCVTICMFVCRSICDCASICVMGCVTYLHTGA